MNTTTEIRCIHCIPSEIREHPEINDLNQALEG